MSARNSSRSTTPRSTAAADALPGHDGTEAPRQAHDAIPFRDSRPAPDIRHSLNAAASPRAPPLSPAMLPDRFAVTTRPGDQPWPPTNRSPASTPALTPPAAPPA